MATQKEIEEWNAEYAKKYGLPGDDPEEQRRYYEARRQAWNLEHKASATEATPVSTPTEIATEAPTLEELTPPELPPAPEVTPAPTVEAPKVPPMPEVTPAPTIPTIEVTPAPAYEPTPEQLAWQEEYGGKLSEWLEAGGYGIPEETQRQMIQQQTDALKAREKESIRVMQNNMERRGITNSGFIFANEQAIRATTTKTLAESIRDVQIQSSLMKMASFEKAMGSASQFLGYLSEQSQLKYAPKFATWQAQTSANMTKYKAEIETSLDKWRMENQFAIAGWEAQKQALFSQWEVNANNIVDKWKMENQFALTEWQSRAEYNFSLFNLQSQLKLAQWQGQMDLYKMQIAQAYQQQNMELAHQLEMESAEQQHQYDIELAQMELDAQQQAAAAEGAGSLIGSASGAVATIISGK